MSMDQSAQQQPFALVQISDPHLYANPQTEYRGWRTDAALDAVFEQLRGDGQPVDALLLTGDLAQDASAAAYTRLDAKLADWPVPCYALPGNHDDPRVMCRHLGAGLLGEARLGAWRLLLLSSWRAGTVSGYLTDSELERARQFVAQLDRPGLIAVHHQPVAVGSPWIDALGLENGAALMALASGQPWLRGILFGHVHQRFDARRHGLRILGCPSTWRQFAPGADTPQEDPQARPGYRRIWLYPDGRLRSRIHRLPASD